MKKQLILLPLVAMALVACGNGGETSSSSSSSSVEPAWTGKTNADFSKAKTTYMDGDKEKQLNRNTLFKNQNAPHLDPMSTESHVMVVPFSFTDKTSEQTPENLARLQTAFMGSTEEIQAKGGWESLSSFYTKSSYGKTQFGGQVLPTWCVYDGTVASYGASHKDDAGRFASEYARDWYLEEYAKANHGALGADAHDITWFDADSDGFLDLVWVVYTTPMVDVNTAWWAYVTYTGNSKSLTKPTVQTLGWASINCLDEGLHGYDTHTFIHETGHTFGLDDYYDYNATWSPMGGIDFMDHNVGDHSMYSKFSLGWTNPLVVDDTARITLHPGTSTGDCFLLPSPNYNGTAFDEYMMVELMAPTGLAEYDYKNGSGFAEPGIRITHVDARVYKNDVNTPLTSNPQEGVDVRLDNSYQGRTITTSNHMYHDFMPREDGTKMYEPHFSIMESSFSDTNNWTLNSSYTVSDKALFKKNARFNLKSTDVWAPAFMPSGTNLWNKAKTITEWSNWKDPKNDSKQKYTIDETCTFNYSLKVVSIEQNAEFGYEAVVEVKANAY